MATAVLAQGEGAGARAQVVLSLVDLIRVNDQVLRAAGTLLPPHDERMTAAARFLTLRTAAPT